MLLNIKIYILILVYVNFRYLQEMDSDNSDSRSGSDSCSDLDSCIDSCSDSDSQSEQEMECGDKQFWLAPASTDMMSASLPPNVTLTENSSYTFASTTSFCLDFYFEVCLQIIVTSTLCVTQLVY